MAVPNVKYSRAEQLMFLDYHHNIVNDGRWNLRAVRPPLHHNPIEMAKGAEAQKAQVGESGAKG